MSSPSSVTATGHTTLTASHQSQLVHYLSFNKYKRRQSVNELRQVFRNTLQDQLANFATGTVTSSVYTHQDVEHIVSTVQKSVSSCFEGELVSLTHSQLILVMQFLTTAQALGVELSCGLEMLEDPDMLARVAELEREWTSLPTQPAVGGAVMTIPNGPSSKPEMKHAATNTDPPPRLVPGGGEGLTSTPLASLLPGVATTTRFGTVTSPVLPTPPSRHMTLGEKGFSSSLTSALPVTTTLSGNTAAETAATVGVNNASPSAPPSSPSVSTVPALPALSGNVASVTASPSSFPPVPSSPLTKVTAPPLSISMASSPLSPAPPSFPPPPHLRSASTDTAAAISSTSFANGAEREAALKTAEALATAQAQIRALQAQVTDLQRDLKVRIDQSGPVKVLLGYLDQKNEELGQLRSTKV